MPHTVAIKPLALLCASFTLLLTGCDAASAPSSANSSAPDVQVMTLHATALAITTELPGRTSAFRVAEIRPQVSGIVLQRAFREGSDVVAGQTLYQVDPTPFRASYESARAALSQAEANARIAQLTLTRYRALGDTQYVSRQEVDQAQATAAQTRAAVDAQIAATESARINLLWSTLKSPISGRIGRSSVTEGALVQSGQNDALATVQQLDPLYVDVTQSSDDFLHLQQAFSSGHLQQNSGKTQVNVVLSDGSLYPHSGTLAFSDVTVDATTGAITLRAIVPNPEHQLLPGMFVRARLDEGHDPQALLIPQQAVTRTPRGQATTLVVGVDDKVEVRAITVAEAVGDAWRVSGGVQAGERVIVSGLQRAQPGMVVHPVTLPTPTGSAH